MKDTPASGPMHSSSTHQDRETISSRHSFSRSQKKGGLRERKEDLFQILRRRRGTARGGQRRKFGDCAFAAYSAAAEQDEAVADARGLADLVNGEEERAPAGGVPAEGGRDIACL